MLRRRLRRAQIGHFGVGSTLGAHAAADEHATQKDDHRHDRGSHEEKYQLLSIQLDFVKAVILGMSRQSQGDFSMATSLLASVDDGSSTSARSASTLARVISFD